MTALRPYGPTMALVPAGLLWASPRWSADGGAMRRMHVSIRFGRRVGGEAIAVTRV